MPNRNSLHAVIPSLLSVLIVSHAALGDIYQWELVNPADPSLGRQASSTLCPDGEGRVPAPGLYASYDDLTQAWLSGYDLTDAEFWNAHLTDADFTETNLTRVEFGPAYLTGAYLTQANLTDANLKSTILTDADLTGATIAGADLSFTVSRGFTRTQFESTASYASGDLTEVMLEYNDLSSWNFVGKNLTDASLDHSTLTNADLSQANLTDVGFYNADMINSIMTQANLTYAHFGSADLTNADLSRANLTAAYFFYDTLAGVDLTQANLTNAWIESADLTGANLTGATTAGANFNFANLTDADLTQANLADTDFGVSRLTNADLSGATITGADFEGAILTNAELTGADARGAYAMSYNSAASLVNFVHPNGEVVGGLNVTAGEQFRVWDYDGLLGITVMDEFVIDNTGLLIVRLEDDVWGSTIAFDAGIGVTFDGTLEVELRNGFTPIVGDEWQLFDFAGITPTGGFDAFVLPTLADGMQWDTANLMNTGVLAVTAGVEPVLPGDLDGDGFVGITDLSLVLANWNQNAPLGNPLADPSGDGFVGIEDLNVVLGNWNAGTPPGGTALPEPGTLAVMALGLLALSRSRQAC
jgi:uncharacterized protein YjbI with pentapeptide repeats